MPKHRVLLAAPAGMERAAFQAMILRDVAPALAGAVPGLAALSVNLVDATPAVLPWLRPNEGAPPEAPTVDALVEVLGEDAATAAVAWLMQHHGAHILSAVQVEQRIEKDALPRPVGITPGVKFLSLMTFHDDLPAPAARRLWAHHAALALRVHVGVARYVRDWVVQRTDGPRPLPLFHGIAELHFPTVQAMMERWFDSAEGHAAIVHDVGHFLSRATRLYTTEHVLLA